MAGVFGFVGSDFVLLAADSSVAQSIVVQKTDEDKILKLDSHKLMASDGESGDRVQFSEFIQKNLSLYQFRNGTPLSTAAAANFTRNELAVALRKNPYYVNLIIGGFDKEKGPSMYYLDYIATLHSLEKGALGYGAYFVLSVMDKYYKKGMNLDEGLELAARCIAEIQKRLIVAPPKFIVKVVDKDGFREVSLNGSSAAATAATPMAIVS